MSHSRSALTQFVLEYVVVSVVNTQEGSPFPRSCIPPLWLTRTVALPTRSLPFRQLLVSLNLELEGDRRFGALPTRAWPHLPVPEVQSLQDRTLREQHVTEQENDNDVDVEPGNG